MILRLRVFWPTNVRSQIFSVIRKLAGASLLAPLRCGMCA